MKSVETNSVYCMQCRKKVLVVNPTLTKKEIKKGSYRHFIKGVCPNCKSKVSGLVKNPIHKVT